MVQILASLSQLLNNQRLRVASRGGRMQLDYLGVFVSCDSKFMPCFEWVYYVLHAALVSSMLRLCLSSMHRYDIIGALALSNNP